MLKSESLKQLDDLGLNTLNYFITRNQVEAERFLRKEGKDKLMSLRTERGNDFNCPFFYGKHPDELAKEFARLIREGYTLILSNTLFTKGCLAYGTVGLGTQEDVMEFVLGEGKVRDLESHPGRQSITISLGKMSAVSFQDYPGKAHLINHVYKEVKERCYDLRPCILEWSYYEYPVGKLNHNSIYWEIRSYV